MNDWESGTSRGTVMTKDFDVFLNSPGLWQDSFVPRLENALRCAGYRPFLGGDSWLLKRIPGQFQYLDEATAIFQSFNTDEALEMAKVHVAVVLMGFAESTFCLNQLVDMVGSGKQVLPVFYGVEPKDLQSVDGPFAAELKRHESEGWDLAIVDDWRVALRELSKIPGFRLADHRGGYESELIQDVVAHLTQFVIPLHSPATSSFMGKIRVAKRTANKIKWCAMILWKLKEVHRRENRERIRHEERNANSRF